MNITKDSRAVISSFSDFASVAYELANARDAAGGIRKLITRGA